MKPSAIFLMAFFLAASNSARLPIWAQAQPAPQQPAFPQQPETKPQSDAAQPPAGSSQSTMVQPASADDSISTDEQLGVGDLVNVTVYDSPELSRPLHIDSDGSIRMPMVHRRIHAAGLTPSELENAIAATLISENVLVNPVVSIAVTEIHSRAITVEGAVRNPVTIQQSGPITLFEALTRAGGITDNAGSEVLISHPSLNPDGKSVFLTERIPLRALKDLSNPAANLKLEGGEFIRVPSAGQIFVAGNVKRPGPFVITNDSQSSVLRALSIAGGLDSFSSKTAYIYRTDENSGSVSQIPIPVKKIVARKSADMPLYGDDMLYIPSLTSQRASAKALEILFTVGLGLVGVLLYVTQ